MSVSPQPVTIPEPDWRRQLRAGISDPARLLECLQLGEYRRLLGRRAERAFPQRVPRAYIQRMRPGDINDPLLRQVLPLVDEEFKAEGFSDDPIAERHYLKTPGLIHKYHGRVLLIAAGGCAINCRYCFRRSFPYRRETLNHGNWQQCLDYIKQRGDLTEVIFSGGDPLMLPTRRLESMTNDLLSIGHLERLRIHTRLPVVIPDRVNQRLCDWLGSASLPVCMVLHINHAREIDDAVQQACQRLRRCGVILLNQAVLLHGVNDTPADQIELAGRLFETGVLPYYLHQLDPVTGAAHFQVDDRTAIALHQQMQRRLPGYLVARLVRDLPGKPCKYPLQSRQ